MYIFAVHFADSKISFLSMTIVTTHKGSVCMVCLIIMLSKTIGKQLHNAQDFCFFIRRTGV